MRQLDSIDLSAAVALQCAGHASLPSIREKQACPSSRSLWQRCSEASMAGVAVAYLTTHRRKEQRSGIDVDARLGSGRQNTPERLFCHPGEQTSITLSVFRVIRWCEALAG